VPSTDPGPFLLLATVSDPAAADLCAALLRSEGIESRLRGESLGPYRLTIGEMAATQVWVPLSRLDDARSLVAEGDISHLELADGEPERAPAPPKAGWSPLTAALGALLLVLTLWLVVARLL